MPTRSNYSPKPSGRVKLGTSRIKRSGTDLLYLARQPELMRRELLHAQKRAIEAVCRATFDTTVKGGLPAVVARGRALYEHRPLPTLILRTFAASLGTGGKKISPKAEKRIYQKKLALLLPAHNEELIIAATIRSAIAAGQNKGDIFVVDDCSTDGTRKEAVKLLGRKQVLSVERSGKARAVKAAIEKFNIEQNYRWLHIADADSVFSRNYFRIYRKKLNHKKYAVAVGFVQSMRGNWISDYRAITYTYSQHVNRRIQSYLGMISVFPGPITSFRTDILKEIDFDTGSVTEDFDITLQVHRKKLGKIHFIPRAVNYTQDPQTLRDFWRQNLRWQTGFFQGVLKYRIGLNPKTIDLSIGFQIFQTLFYLFQMFVLIPALIVTTGQWIILPLVLAADIIVTSLIAISSSAVTRRWSLIGAIPYFYFLRWVEIGIFLTAFVQVVALKNLRSHATGWATEGRRYQISAQALRDLAR